MFFLVTVFISACWPSCFLLVSLAHRNVELSCAVMGAWSAWNSRQSTTAWSAWNSRWSTTATKTMGIVQGQKANWLCKVCMGKSFWCIFADQSQSARLSTTRMGHKRAQVHTPAPPGLTKDLTDNHPSSRTISQCGKLTTRTFVTSFRMRDLNPKSSSFIPSPGPFSKKSMNFSL